LHQFKNYLTNKKIEFMKSEKIKRTGKITIIENEAGQWNWNLKAANGEIICFSNQGHETRQMALKGVQSAKKNINSAEVKFINNEGHEI